MRRPDPGPELEDGGGDAAPFVAFRRRAHLGMGLGMTDGNAFRVRAIQSDHRTRQIMLFAVPQPILLPFPRCPVSDSDNNVWDTLRQL